MEHKADYVPSREGAARAKDLAAVGRYVEWRQGLRRWGEDWGIGLKYRTIGEIWTKNGARGQGGLGLTEARSYRHNRGVAGMVPFRVSLRV